MTWSKEDLEALIKQECEPKERKKETRTSNSTWRFSSQKDPRWTAEGTYTSGGDRPPDEMVAKLKEFRKLYGEPPDDIEAVY
jgi:hypothetical protein